MSPAPRPATVSVTPEELAALRAGLWATASEPSWNLAMRVLDRLEGRAVGPMSPEVARAWMAIVAAPVGLAGAKATIESLHLRIDSLERERGGQA